MEKFILGISKFVFFIVAIYFSLFIVVVLSKKLKQPCSLDLNTRYLIVGDSHIMWGINDEYLSTSQNIALNGECYLYTYVKLKHVLSQPNNVEKIYLGLSWHNLSEYFDAYIYGDRAMKYFYRYVDILTFNEYFELCKENPKTTLKMSGEVIKSGITGLIKTGCDFIGYFPHEKMIQTTSLGHIKKRIKHQYYSEQELVSYSNINLKYLDKIITLCKTNNLSIAFINTPLQKKYKELIPQKFKKIYDQIIVDNALEVVDFDGFELPDSCFLPDGDHLNYYGAIKTSKRLNAIMNSSEN